MQNWTKRLRVFKQTRILYLRYIDFNKASNKPDERPLQLDVSNYIEAAMKYWYLFVFHFKCDW